MPPLPPAALVLDAIRQTVLPAAGGAALVLCALLALGRWAAALGSAAAVVAGFAWANYTFDAPSWDNTGRVFPWKPDGPTWQYLPRAALVLVAVGLLSRWVGLIAGRYLPERRRWGANLLVWAPRLAGVAVVSGWLVPLPWAADMPWLWPALAAAMLLTWAALDGVARSGAGAEVSAYQCAAFLAAGAVLIHAHSARFMDAANILGFALLGVAVAAGAAKTDASGAAPATAAFLPGLMLNGRYQTESAVPPACFWLVGLAPLALLPFLVPRVARQNRWLLAGGRAALVLAPLVVAVVLAMRHETLVFEEEWAE